MGHRLEMTYVSSGSRTTARPDQAALVGVHDSLHPVPQRELIQHPADVCLDRGLGQEELGGDLGVGQARGDLDEDLLFAGGERVEPGRTAGGCSQASDWCNKLPYVDSALGAFRYLGLGPADSPPIADNAPRI